VYDLVRTTGESLADDILDLSAPTRELVRILKTPPDHPSRLPESVCWQVFLELKRRGEPTAGLTFLGGLKSLHRRRTMVGSALSIVDADPQEHKLAEDPYLGELWRSYKRLLCANRTGPAAQILREVEQQLQAS
jgi:hypothetical protein